MIAAYFVNLPNAFVSYILKYEQFPVMKFSPTVTSIITICLLIVFFKLLRSRQSQNAKDLQPELPSLDNGMKIRTENRVRSRF